MCAKFLFLSLKKKNQPWKFVINASLLFVCFGDIIVKVWLPYLVKGTGRKIPPMVEK